MRYIVNTRVLRRSVEVIVILTICAHAYYTLRVNFVDRLQIDIHLRSKSIPENQSDFLGTTSVSKRQVFANNMRSSIGLHPLVSS